MKSKKRIMVVIAVVALLLLSVQTVFANYSNGPENPGGGIVFREEDIFLLETVDFEKELTALINGDIVEWCETWEEPLVFFDVQYLSSPSNENRIFQIFQADDVHTEVWDFLIDWEVETVEELCAQFNGKEPIAEGLTKVRGTDNDLIVFLYPNNNANAFGWVSQGQLYSPEGEKIHFNGVFRVTWDGEDGERGNVVSKINLTIPKTWMMVAVKLKFRICFCSLCLKMLLNMRSTKLSIKMLRPFLAF